MIKTKILHQLPITVLKFASGCLESSLEHLVNFTTESSGVKGGGGWVLSLLQNVSWCAKGGRKKILFMHQFDCLQY